MTPLLWFIAGGFSALFIARAVGRWMRRLFWVLVASAFAIWAVFVVGPGLGLVAGEKTLQRPSLATVRGLLEVAADWFR